MAKIDTDALSPDDYKKYEEVLIEIGPLKDLKAERFCPKLETVQRFSELVNDLCGKSNKTLLNGVQRCFRGTGELPNNKDLAYYNGANHVWQYIEEHIDDPELFDNLFLVGKLDVTNPEQERISYAKRTGSI